MTTDWSARYARRLQWMSTSVIREILKVAQSPDIISMAGGWPEADLFPVAQLQEVAEHVMANQTREALQYGLTEGLPALRQALSDLAKEEGVPSAIDNVVITSGSQQALDLMGRLFLDEGDTVLVESPTFVGALQSFNAYGVRYAPVPLDDAGVRLDLLEEALRAQRPKFMYIQPNFQNPMGVSLSLERRVRLVELADAYGVPILEDDPYGQLRFSGEPLPSLLALDAARHPENAVAGRYVAGNVVHLGSFSKTLTPGLRVAWAMAPVELAQQFVMAKQGSDLHTSALGQAMAAEFLRRGWLPAQVERIRRTYLERRDAMIAALEDYLPAGVQYTRPEGGLFLWMTLPEGIDTVPLLSVAAARKVAFVPGGPFYTDGKGANTLRVTYASMPPERIREGVRRLAEVIREAMA
jgi:2-aminoadipate transaminase